MSQMTLLKPPDIFIDQNVYENSLSADLQFRKRRVESVQAGIAYQFQVKTEKETVTMQVQFTSEH